MKTVSFEDLEFHSQERIMQYLRDIKQRESMENRYDHELLELAEIYGKIIDELHEKHAKGLDGLVKAMSDFVELHQARRKVQKKLEILGCKLKAERAPCCGNECQDCDCEDDDDE